MNERSSERMWASEHGYRYVCLCVFLLYFFFSFPSAFVCALAVVFFLRVFFDSSRFIFFFLVVFFFGFGFLMYACRVCILFSYIFYILFGLMSWTYCWYQLLPLLLPLMPYCCWFSSPSHVDVCVCVCTHNNNNNHTCTQNFGSNIKSIHIHFTCLHIVHFMFIVCKLRDTTLHKCMVFRVFHDDFPQRFGGFLLILLFFLTGKEKQQIVRSCSALVLFVSCFFCSCVPDKIMCMYSIWLLFFFSLSCAFLFLL